VLIKGKNAEAWHAKRAGGRGYRLRHIDRNAHIDDIHAINTSWEERQGRLVAYANLGHYGNSAWFSQLIGIRNNDGIMHMMVVDIVSELIGERRVRYLMYDTFFGAQPGMQTFKKFSVFVPTASGMRCNEPPSQPSTPIT
jgi:hypothetical protein